MSDAIELYSKLNDPMAACVQLGEWFAKSGMFKVRNVEQGQLLAFICMAEKKSPTELIRENHIMEDGTLAPKSRNVHARFLERGGDVEWITLGDEEGVDFEQRYAEAIFRFKGRERKIRFSIAEARIQQLKVDKENGNWRKTPGNMLRARVLTKGIDLFCPDIVLGVPEGIEFAEPAPPVALNLDPKPVNAPPSPTPANQPKQEPKVVDVQVVDPPTKASSPAPVAQSATATGVATPVGELPPDILSKVETVIGVNGVAALRWLRANGKLKDGQGLQNLGAKMAEQIINRPEAFIRAITTQAVTKPAA